jgi:hypothetical protein
MNTSIQCIYEYEYILYIGIPQCTMVHFQVDSALRTPAQSQTLRKAHCAKSESKHWYALYQRRWCN